MALWLLLHGTPLRPSVWDAVAASLPGEVVIPDLTRVPPILDAQAAMAAVLVAALPDHIDVNVVGHSFGGQIGIEAALLLGPRLRSLTIMCSRDSPVPSFAAFSSALKSGQIPPVEQDLARWFTPPELATDDPIVQATRSTLEEASIPDWSNAIAAIAVFDRTASVGAITAPVTLLAAGLDHVSTPEAMKAFAARLPDARLIVREDWAHMSGFLHPDQLAQLILGPTR